MFSISIVLIAAAAQAAALADLDLDADPAGLAEPRPTAKAPTADHLMLDRVVPHLPQLTSLRLVYGVRDCGMNFTWSLFGMTLADVGALGRSVHRAPQLARLAVHNSLVDDALARALAPALAGLAALAALDLAHNRIADRFAELGGATFFYSTHSTGSIEGRGRLPDWRRRRVR